MVAYSGLLRKPDASSVSAMGGDLWSYGPGRDPDRFQARPAGVAVPGGWPVPPATALRRGRGHPLRV